MFDLILITFLVVGNCYNSSGVTRCFWTAKDGGGADKTGDLATGRVACQADSGDVAVIETEDMYDFVVTR